MADEKKMKKYYLRYWWLALLAMLCKGLEVMADLVQPALMASIVDEGILGIGNGGTADLSIVKSLGLKMLVIIAAGGFAGWIGGVFSNNYGQRSGNDIRKDCFQKVLHFSFSQVDRFTPGSLITRVSSDVTQVQLMLSDMVRGCMRSLVFLVAGTWFLLSLDLNFRTILTIAIVLVLLEIIWTVWKTNPMFMSLQEKLDRVNTVMRENISGVRVVKAFAQEERENARFQKANHDLAKNQFEVLLRISYLQPVMNLVFNLAAAAKEILDTRPDVVSGTVTQGTSKGTIAFDHVCFRYQKMSSDVLSDLNLEIHAGESIAIIGSTGSGKSSMINLIPRFYDVTHGTVKVDGVDVRDWDLTALRKRISVVMQKSELFSVSLRQNIAMGNPAASEQDIMEAAKTAQADDYIRAQRDGYDTMVAEGGTSLSGGQKQRLSIARALVKKAEILILDDATSALDLETEAALYNALRKQMHEMTTLVITQRIATARRCDRIVVLDHGCLVGVGRHEDLLASCPVYADICSSQRMKGDARNG